MADQFNDLPQGATVVSVPTAAPQYSDLPAGATVVSAPSSVTNVRYIVPGQGVQEFTKGSTDEQQFLQRFPNATVVPGKTGTFQRNVLPNEQIDTESPEVRGEGQTRKRSRLS